MTTFWLVVATGPPRWRLIPMDVAWLQLDTSIGAVPTHFGPLQVVWRAGNSSKVYITCDTGISYGTDTSCDDGIIYVTDVYSTLTHCQGESNVS